MVWLVFFTQNFRSDVLGVVCSLQRTGFGGERLIYRLCPAFHERCLYVTEGALPAPVGDGCCGRAGLSALVCVLAGCCAMKVFVP